MDTTHTPHLTGNTLETALRHLESSAGPRPRLCAAMLLWATGAEGHRAAAWLPAWFMPHFHDALCSLPREEALFALFEDMALLARAHAVSCRPEMIPEPLAAVMTAFEADGEWHPNDGTLVSEWYWLRLPAIGMASRLGADVGLFGTSGQPFAAHGMQTTEG
ncbi:hypothetical protein [Nitratidesulfovibrio vulgaris]|uniref:hypothetical protein n=1 Tax=Nitratidesulfovibrio vulgaris TaxID=881 RepID=UPI002301B578|nr:hypothetical protein [Nitratidesulfovibrio vulgaris]WCB47409.1 hypothetical protein PH214_04825 [Nitratidesulfovibrio vulgaris]